MLTSHDGEGHIIRMFEFNRALDDGNFPARWSKRLNWGLGYPFFNFNYPLPYYLGYLMNKAGLDLLAGFKIILILSVPLSAFFSFLWLKNHFSQTSAIAGGLFYTLIPYHLVNIYVRGNLAETLALTLVPLNFYLIHRLKQKPTFASVIWLSLGLSALILSHNISALLFLPVILIYSLLLNLSKNYLKLLGLAFILPLFITCFFWLPALFDKQFIIIDQRFPLYYAKNFPKLADLIYSPWGYGGSNTGPGQMSVQVGLGHWLIFICSVIILVVGFRKLKHKKLVFFFLGLSVWAFLMMLSISKPVWDLVTPLQYLQFPWRLLSILALAVSFLASFTFSFVSQVIPKKINLVLTVIAIMVLLFVNRHHFQANQYYRLPDYWFLDSPYGSTTTVDGEHTPKWQMENRPDQTARFELLSGTASINSLVWKTNYHRFQVEAKSEITMVDRTVYFPGWIVFVDQQKINTINQDDPKTKGLISFEVPAGQHLVEVKLLEPPVHQVANTVTAVSIALVLGFAIYRQSMH